MLLRAHSPKTSVSTSHYRVLAFDLLRIGRAHGLWASHEQNPIDIPKQEEFSSVLQRYTALVDIQIEWCRHWESVTQIQDFDSGLVKIGLVIGDRQTQLPRYDSLHQQEV